ncbi:MAG TPA: tRNA glutamyl-Q(34) synthetase GluQRS, partial [Xanthomonadales bacterium]|nr:tRNA glutamyl-Q(34) synthetase GluQRS [Xanthomonadales bacterium]
MGRQQSRQPEIGRFAPSPTGELHFGSLLAAVASYLQARSTGGQWLVRIEDIDPPREVAGSAQRILKDLLRLGLRSDLPVLYQSTRRAAYRAAADNLLERGLAFRCGCSRADLPACGVYPGTCREGLPPGRKPRTIRLVVPEKPLTFTDQIQGPISENLAETVGDFVLWRADDLPAYQLAVVVDDAFGQISQVVRGADLLDSTARQIWLQRCLGLPTPSYAHYPVVVGQDGNKLSKRLGSDPIATAVPARALEAALRFLGQPCPADLDLDSLWRWAQQHWQLSAV